MDLLKLIGFNDDALTLNFSFLLHRREQVVINNTVSDFIENFQGVPQGTVLGPLLFNTYNTDITKHISEECRIIQYADECSVYSANPKFDIAFENLQISVKNVEKYFRSNQVTLNASKTELIRFTTPKLTVSNNQLIVAGSNTKLRNEVKYLGIIIYNKLTFETQVQSLLQKWPLALKQFKQFATTYPKNV